MPPPGALTLPADLGVENSARLHRQLAAHAEDAAPVPLAAAEVARLHAASLQVLVAFVRTRAAAGLATVWLEPSVELRAAADTLGLAALLGLPATH